MFLRTNLDFVYDSSVAAHYLTSCQVLHTHADITPIYIELYLLPMALVPKRWPLPHMKEIAAAVPQRY